MNEHSALKDAFDRIAPSFTSETGDWQRVLRNAGVAAPGAGFLARLPIRRRRSRWAVAAALVAVLIALFALPAFGVGRDLFALRLNVPGEPKPTSERVLITSGVSSGVRWTLTAYMTDRGICVDVNTPNGSGGGCGAGVRGLPGLNSRGWIGPAGIGWSNEIPSSLFASGAVAAGVARVELVLAGGTTVGAEPIPAPRALGVPLGFYVAELPRDSVVRAIVAEDEYGAVLQTKHVPARLDLKP